MFLSRLTLNPRSGCARSDISNPYELHRTLLKAFSVPMHPDERLLFRLEAPARSGQAYTPYVLVQSQGDPDWSVLEERGADYLAEAPAVKCIAALHFKAGQQLRFRLRANPSKRLAKTGKRVGIYKQDERTSWLQRKANASGFEVVESALIVRAGGIRSFKKKKKNKEFKITLNAVDFDGWLVVRDAASFMECIKQGIGPAKGLGCGMLTVATG